MSRNRVAVTGLGLMTGLGLDMETSWKGLIAGRSVTSRFKRFDPEGLACTFGVELPEEAEELFARHIKKRQRGRMTTGTMIAVVTAIMAMEDAGLDLDENDKKRVGVVVGTTGTGYTPSGGGVDTERILKNMSNSPATWISLKHGLRGPSFVVGTACSSGAYALGAAHSLIATDQCDVVIAGAVDSSVNYLDVEGFCSLMALAERQEDVAMACRPFDKDRNGFVVGEGGGFLVLESPKFASARNAKIQAYMSAPSLYSEAYNILSPQRDGRGMAECMRMALEKANLNPEDMDYINTHGTSTYLNDLYETQAIKTVFGEHVSSMPISSTKSMTGHCLAGAAGVEAAICCKALQENMIPPTINLEDTDPELDLDYVPNVVRKKELNHVMSNSFAFGGHNGVCIFSKT